MPETRTAAGTTDAGKGLSPLAYVELKPGQEYPPFVPAHVSVPEFTIKAAFFGILFGIVFGAANAYLGLRAGLTISTSIPIAVMTVAAFRGLQPVGRPGTILEANISQTIGSASSSLASGVIFTLPALFLWGVAPDLLQMTLLAACGGVLGVLFMIPLRRFLIKGEHGRLPYPEGTACAEVLVANEVGGSSARYVFYGLGLGALLQVPDVMDQGDSRGCLDTPAVHPQRRSGPRLVRGAVRRRLHPRTANRRGDGGRRLAVVDRHHSRDRVVG